MNIVIMITMALFILSLIVSRIINHMRKEHGKEKITALKIFDVLATIGGVISLVMLFYPFPTSIDTGALTEMPAGTSTRGQVESVANDFGNMYYSNNGGLLAIQDKAYYIGTKHGLYKTEDFKDFTKLCDKAAASYVNVVGNHVFFTDGNRAYKMKTDGKNLEVLLEDSYIHNMQVYGGYLYYINGDYKLYRTNLNNNNPKEKLSNDNISAFALSTDSIIYVESEFSSVEGGGTSWKGKSVKRIELDGSNLSIILEETKYDPNLHDKYIIIPLDICYFESEFYTLNDYSLIKINARNEMQKMLNLIDYGHSLCIIDGFAYYTSDRENSMGSITRISLSTLIEENLGKPFDDGSEFEFEQVPMFYPIKDKIIIVQNYCDDYYIWDYNDKKLDKLPI